MNVQIAYLILAIGILLLIFLGMNAFFKYLKLPPLIGYIILGWVVRLIVLPFITDDIRFVFNFLANIGVILLLFHIGIESHFKKLLRVVVKAGFVSFCEIIVSGALAFLVAYLFGFSLIASLCIGVALMATSIGVTTFSWGEKALSEKKEGSFLLDLASFDDIISIILLSILFSSLGVGENLIILFVKLILFIIFCYLFAHFAEKRILTDLLHYEKMPDSMLSVVGIGLLIAAIAALIHFSLVIGAFFAGIAFSRDPRALKIDISMKTLLDFFVPFFFFWIGYQIDLTALFDSWLFLFSLFVIAILGKLVGVWIPSLLVKMSALSGLLLAISMVPRAEVTMVVINQALKLDWITGKEYSAVTLVVLGTCLLGALFTRFTLNKFTQS